MKISIIIPAYNAEKYIDNCLESISNQLFKDFEVIIINDGSTDLTGVICDKWSENYSNINVIHTKNYGSANARNIGLSKAKGDYISFIDADDYIECNFLKILCTNIIQNNCQISMCNFQVVNTIKYTSYKSNNIAVINNIDLLEEFCNKKTYMRTAVLWNKLFKKELFDGLEFEINRGVDDEYLIHQLIYRATKIVKTDAYLYFYYMSENSQMRSAPSLKKLDGLDAIEKQLSFLYRNDLLLLHNKLLYRYFSAVISGYNLVTNYYPNEVGLIKDLRNKRKKLYTIYFIKEVRLVDKIIIFVKRFFPKFFDKING